MGKIPSLKPHSKDNTKDIINGMRRLEKWRGRSIHD